MLMTLGLSKDIQCHLRPYSILWLQVTKSNIIPQVKWAVRLVNVDGHFHLPIKLCGYV